MENKSDHIPDVTKMMPLTMEQLRHMDGKPVFVHVIDHTVFSDKDDDFDAWGLCRKSWVTVWDEKRADIVNVDYDFDDLGKTWIAYAYPPAHIDLEAWECEYCTGDVDDRPFLDSNDLYISGDGWLTSDYQDHDFCKIQFCPKCGRPLTPEARDVLEKRLRGCIE